MVTLFKEVTSRGDSFGFSVDSKNRKVNKAVRVFIIQVDTTEDRNIAQIYTYLPDKGSVHPYIPDCYVKDVLCEVTDDVHVYEAKVTYETTVIEDDITEEPDITYPWEEDASISFSTDTSLSGAAELAYAKWDYTEVSISSDPPSDFTGKIEGITPFIPIVNEPLKERFSSIPEEPISCMAIDISFAVKGYTTNRRIHNRAILYDLKNEYLTVNNTDVTLFGYTISAYKGYVVSCSLTDKFFISKKNRKYAYYEVQLKILDNPRTWIRLVQNMSLNTLKENPDNPGQGVITRIKIKDGDSGVPEPITQPMLIHPNDASPIGLDADGNIQEDNRVYVIPYLTKRPDDWTAIVDLCDKAS